VIIAGVLLFTNRDTEEETPAQVVRKITIDEPVQGAVVDIANPVTVSGTGGGLPEGNVVVQAIDRDGNVLAEQPTTIDAPDAGTGGQGPWSVQLSIDTEPGMEGLLRAFSLSPADNSVMAEAAINIILGQAEAPDPPTAQISGPTQGETGETLSFDGSASSGENAIVEYIWDFGNGNGATGPQVDQEYDEPGNYTVSLTVTDDEGLQGNSNLAVQIYPVVEAPDLTDLENKDWFLVEAATFDVDPLTALFQAGTVSGFSGCNTYTGSYQSDGSSLTISDITTTQLACDEDSITRENSYLANLGSVNGYVVQGKQLTLTGAQPLTFMEQ
jgi:heat shock protein HslJ